MYMASSLIWNRTSEGLWLLLLFDAYPVSANPSSISKCRIHTFHSHALSRYPLLIRITIFHSSKWILQVLLSITPQPRLIQRFPGSFSRFPINQSLIPHHSSHLSPFTNMAEKKKKKKKKKVKNKGVKKKKNWDLFNFETCQNSGGTIFLEPKNASFEPKIISARLTPFFFFFFFFFFFLLLLLV